ncbi:inositol oxygenase-like isoform X2 [Maniola hyperantus]|uniref:inositol oxygenase-like isoform X2 n=1 Tax=Aphantopus hyperantus TaxID=2795564 RepID=UPI0037496298
MKFRNPDNTITLMDPSLLLRPEQVYKDKPLECFRDYSVNDEDPIKERVRRTYYTMHSHMTVDFVKSKMEKWLKFNHFKSSVKDALVKLNELVDESDPDTDLPNIVHAFQTAERIREDYPEDDWFQLIGLIHDLGKVMAFYDEPQWCVVGDTFPVGCRWGQNIVYGDDSFRDNPDTYDDKYRFHSFYPWHAGGDYSQFVTDEDEKIRQAVLKFNQYDLYTKSAGVPDIEALWPYYEGLIEKYIPGVLEW